MCRVVQRSYAPRLTAARDARHLTTLSLRGWELPELVDTAALLVSEVVTNAVTHAGGEIALTLAVAEGALEVGVSDHEPRLPRVRPVELPELDDAAIAWLSSHGRGMLLVDRLADEWGVEEFANGKQTWFRLATAPTWRHASACICGGANLDAVRLGSGRSAIDLLGRQ